MSKVGEHTFHWKWKKFIIDFNEYQDMKSEHCHWDWPKDMDWKKKYNGDGYKLQYGFHYVGTPTKGLYEWYNGGYSSEYNTALNYLIELGLIIKLDETRGTLQ